MPSPRRIQLRRTSGWRKPAGAIVVARPSKWGNPFVVDPTSSQTYAAPDRATAVRLFSVALRNRTIDYPDTRHIRAELAGRDLACWCPLDGPCHADVLLEIANDPG